MTLVMTSSIKYTQILSFDSVLLNGKTKTSSKSQKSANGSLMSACFINATNMYEAPATNTYVSVAI